MTLKLILLGILHIPFFVFVGIILFAILSFCLEIILGILNRFCGL